MPLPYTQTPCSLPYLLMCCFTTDALEPSAPTSPSCAWGTTEHSSPEMFAVCLQQRGRKPDQLGSSCARVEGNSLWVDIWVRRKCQAPSPSTGTAQVKQGACKSVRSLQGPLSTVISCKGCELAAWDSLKPPGRSQPEERQQRAVSHCSDPPDTHQTNLHWLFSCTAYEELCGHEEKNPKSPDSGLPSCPVFSR